MEAGLNASLKLQHRETMEIRTKHLGAGFEASFEAGLEGLKAMEIGAKQYDKEGALFWLQLIYDVYDVYQRVLPMSMSVLLKWQLQFWV